MFRTFDIEENEDLKKQGDEIEPMGVPLTYALNI